MDEKKHQFRDLLVGVDGSQTPHKSPFLPFPEYYLHYLNRLGPRFPMASSCIRKVSTEFLDEALNASSRKQQVLIAISLNHKGEALPRRFIHIMYDPGPLTRCEVLGKTDRYHHWRRMGEDGAK